MSADSVVWKLLTLVVGALTAAAPVYVAYDLYNRGSAPEKLVELRRLPPINPLSDLSPLGDRATLSLKVENQSIDNLVIVESIMRNIGNSPILPSDYHGPLMVSVSSPWKIVAVGNQTDFPVRLHWTRVSDTVFEAQPALLNPDDAVATMVYVTNKKFDPFSTDLDQSEPWVEWNARITNLRAFYEPPDIFEQFRSRKFGIQIQLQGYSLVFTIAFALLSQALYLRLLSKSGYLRGWDWSTIGLIVCASLLSFAAAESSATYLFGTDLTDLWGIDHRLNAPPIIVHVLALLFLYQKARMRATSDGHLGNRCPRTGSQRPGRQQRPHLPLPPHPRDP
jgi:hypothetical protein